MNPLSFIQTSSSSAAAGRIQSAPTRPGESSPRSGAAYQSVREPDSVDISQQARNISSSEAPIRQDLVQQVRAQISAGTYDTPEKYLTALSKAVGQINTTG